MHVTLGILQAATSPLLAALTGTGLVLLLGLHLTAGFRERALDTADAPPGRDGFVDACAVADIAEKRARIVTIAGERVAVFRYDGQISAVSNVCQHQNGPLGEGRIIDGCITCPWHGYQYLPATGASPPPFTEKIPTFDVRVREGRVWVAATPNPPGTRTEPARIDA
jgi:nitrite reductase/ring-hydroxylating ferredoxin subunit